MLYATTAIEKNEQRAKVGGEPTTSDRLALGEANGRIPTSGGGGRGESHRTNVRGEEEEGRERRGGLPAHETLLVHK